MTTQAIRCALLSSFTLDTLPPMVRQRFVADHISLEWYVGGFNQYPQLIVDAGSPLYAFRPSLVFMAVAAEDLFAGVPVEWISSANAGGDKPADRIADYVGLITRLSELLPEAKIVVHNFIVLQPQPHPLLSFSTATTLPACVAQANQALYELAAGHPNVVALDTATLLSTFGLNKAVDARYFYLARMRLGHIGLELLADYYVRVLNAYVGRRKKCIVVDLDNTLWGGILGEDGLNGLQVGQDGIGLAFRTLQARLLAYHQTGTLLAICSKNDEASALAVLREHPSMLLRPEHFSAIRINWLDKSANIRAIAEELKLGLDAFVFLDDSPFEREQVRFQLPDVVVPELPIDPADCPDFIAQLPYFDTLVLTPEDSARGAMYTADVERRAARAQSDSLEAYLFTLGTIVGVRRVTTETLARAAQLTQKTNQFNLTTRRYTEGDLNHILTVATWRLYVASMHDRFGPAGIIGVAIVCLDKAASEARLDTFLLSCRVLGRGVEAAFLAAVIRDLQSQNIGLLRAEYIPTNRNAVARDFLSQQGFAYLDASWVLYLTDAETEPPGWIQLQGLLDDGRPGQHAFG